VKTKTWRTYKSAVEAAQAIGDFVPSIPLYEREDQGENEALVFLSDNLLENEWLENEDGSISLAS
jgi:hypothetical protein